MIVTSDENGRVIAREHIKKELIGEFYRNRISEDYFDENKQRVVTLDTLNDKNQVVARKSFKPSNYSQDGIDTQN